MFMKAAGQYLKYRILFCVWLITIKQILPKFKLKFTCKEIAGSATIYSMQHNL
jgi:hypothetical protein